MIDPRNMYKLIMAGNTNIPPMINAIIRATLEIRANIQDNNLTFRQVHIFHTEQSLKSLMETTMPWQKALEHYSISTTSLVHHVTKIEDSNLDRFRDLVEQLRTIVNPLDNDNMYYYVDLTGGISSLKTILAVFAYVLDIENMYSLEIQFDSDEGKAKRQRSLFYFELVEEKIYIEYRKFPPIRDFDAFGKLNYTEVLRHRQFIANLTNDLATLLPSQFDIKHLNASLLSGVNSRLKGEVTGDSYYYRHSVFSSSAGIEETANIILKVFKDIDVENGTLGKKLGEVRDLFRNNPKYFINADILEHMTRLISDNRNDVVHNSPGIDRDEGLAAIQSNLSSQLAVAFLQFTIKALAGFLDNNGKFVDIQILEAPADTEEKYYFGFDGDATGDYIELAFGESAQDESEVIKRSQIVHKSIQTMKKIVLKETKDQTSILFAEGDNMLFKGPYRHSLLNEMQKVYREMTGLSSSIGYGRTLRETTIAIRLAKAKKGDSIMGIALKKDAF